MTAKLVFGLFLISMSFAASKAPSTPEVETVWVSRPTGAQSCSTREGESLDEAAGRLKKDQVRVLESRKGDDGKMHALMCGAPTGKTNAFRIPKEDLSKAIAAGFQLAGKE
jgi:hypothetical protein